jgi:hypothetical protein
MPETAIISALQQVCWLASQQLAPVCLLLQELHSESRWLTSIKLPFKEDYQLGGHKEEH